MANKAQLIADLLALFQAGSNDSNTMAIGFAEAIDKYSKSLKVKTGTLTSTGTGNLGLPVSSQNNNGGIIE